MRKTWRINLLLMAIAAFTCSMESCNSRAKETDRSDESPRETKEWKRISPVEVKNAVQLFDKD